MQFHAVRDGAGLVLRFKNLPEIIFWKNHGIFLLHSMQSRVAHVQEIRAQWQVRPMLFQNAEREQAGPLRLLNRSAKVFRGQLFPFRRQLGLATRGKDHEQEKGSSHTNSFHKPSRTMTRPMVVRMPRVRVTKSIQHHT